MLKVEKKKTVDESIGSYSPLTPCGHPAKTNGNWILGKIDRSTSFSVFDWDQTAKICHASLLETENAWKSVKLARARGNCKSCLFDSPRLIPPPPPLSHSSRKALYVGNKNTDVNLRGSWFYGLPLSILLGFDTPNVINCIVLTLVINSTERNLWAAYN